MDSDQVKSWLDKQGDSSPLCELSVVIPAYNESRRLPAALIDIIDYLECKSATWEIIVVDDGSRDDTALLVKKFERIRNQIRLIQLPRNYGKGHAVKTGVLNARGALVLFCDADGATPIAEVERLKLAISNGADLAFGSRALKSESTAVKTSWYRKYPGRIFNFLVNLVVLPGVKDTQCGFKLFTKSAVQVIFPKQTADRWSFDVEILLIAKKLGLKALEVPVNWTNIPGSKVNLLTDSIKMARDMFVFRWRHRNLSNATKS
jgi:dolichyl-phosphate beta-glucosyltransferase